jgi:medium-chain acyl-[acyl-carrier-protein] hydrolase
MEYAEILCCQAFEAELSTSSTQEPLYMISNTAWIACPKPKNRSGLRLFCFPYAGGGSSIFRSWADDLSPEIEVCPVLLPGKDDRLLELPFTQFWHLIETLAQVLQPYLEVPFAFFGHSMGGLVAFELARELRRKNAPSPAHLIVSATRAPHLPNPVASFNVDSDVAIIEALRSFNGTPEWVLQDNELMQELLPTIRADFQLVKDYTYLAEAPLDCPISAFGGGQDELVTQEHIEAWKKHTNKFFAMRMFQGSHLFLHEKRSLFLSSISQELCLKG